MNDMKTAIHCSLIITRRLTSYEKIVFGNFYQFPQKLQDSSLRVSCREQLHDLALQNSGNAKVCAPGNAV